MNTTYIIAIVALVIVLFVITEYNKLVKLRNMMQEGWSGIDVQLKKRYELIPNIMTVVKGYAAYESGLLEKITHLRTEGICAETVKAQNLAEKQLSGALQQVFVIAEDYPQLKANENFLALQQKLSMVENNIQMARRYYNGTVRNNNIAVESFPTNILANIFSFKKGDFFELDSIQERIAPQIDL